MKNNLIDPKAAKVHGIKLDAQGWPTTESLQEWHRANNPHLFAQPKQEFHIPLWLLPILPVIIVVILILK